MKQIKTFLVLAILASLTATIVSSVMIKHHVDLSYSAPLCSTNDSSGCDGVNRSAGSEDPLFHIPVAIWGFIFYSIVLLSCLFYFYSLKYSAQIFYIQFAFFLSLPAAFIHSLLILYATIELNAFCVLCFICYIGTLTSAITTTLIIKKLRKEKKEESMKPQWLMSITTLKNISKKQILTFGVALLLVPVLGGCIHANSKKDEKESNDPSVLIKKAFNIMAEKYISAEKNSINTVNAPKKGSKDPAIVVVEYADFMCPHCSVMAQVLDAFKKRCGNLSQVVYKHFPLDKNCNSSMQRQLHKGACELSYASYCAQKQGKFWPMHNAIFANQQDLRKFTMSKVNTLARKSRLNMSRFKSCMKSESTKSYIKADIEEANRLKISSTPTVYVNGKKVNVPVQMPFLLDMIAQQEGKAKFKKQVVCKPE